MADTNSIEGSARAAIDRTAAGGGGGSIGLVLLIAIVLVGAAVALLFIGRANAEPYILGLLAVLAMVGVFLSFALAAGMLRVPGREGASPLVKAVVDGAIEGILVTDARSRVIYANAAYLDLIGATDPKDVRPVERAFIGDPGVSEAVYRLLKAAREGRRLQEEVRVGAHRGEAGRWLRMRVRPLGEGKREARMTVWSLADVTRELERHENVFQELQHAIDYLDHAPAGFFSAEGNGGIVYLNATLANWLDHDLAQFAAGGLKLDDIVAGEGAALLTTLVAAPGDVRTEVFDLDLKTRAGRTLPARLFHKVAFGADGAPGPSRTLVINRSRDEGTDPQRAAEVRFMRFFHNTPMAIATVDKDGRIARSNPRFARLFHPVFKGEGAAAADRSILAVTAERDRGRLEAAIRKAAEGQGEIEPVEAALDSAGERFAIFYVTAIEEHDQRDQEAVIVYALETTQQRSLENQVNQQQKMETIGRLAGSIAHDFNNLLGAIMMATDFLLNAHKPTDPSFQDIMQVKQNANRAASLVRQLLAFSRKQTMRPQVLDLGEAVSDLTVLLRRLIGENVMLDVVHRRDLWPVKADIGQFEQVIINLAVNARDAMPGGGKLTLKTANVTAEESAGYQYKGLPLGEYVLVEVEDTGSGHRAGGDRQDLRPLLHHQGRRQGNGPRALDRLRHRQADRRVHLCEFGAEKGRHLPDLPAALHSGRRRYRDAAAARDTGAGVVRRDVGGRRNGAHRGGRSYRAGHHPAGRGRGGAAHAERPRARLARLHGDRGRQRRGGPGGAGEAGRPRRSRGVGRRDAGNGRSDAAEGTAQAQSGGAGSFSCRATRRTRSRRACRKTSGRISSPSRSRSSS